MRSRYVIVQTSGQWAIYDRQLQALCALEGETLTWPERSGAAGWLYMCRVAWRAELVHAPEGWERAA